MRGYEPPTDSPWSAARDSWPRTLELCLLDTTSVNFGLFSGVLTLLNILPSGKQ